MNRIAFPLFGLVFILALAQIKVIACSCIFFPQSLEQEIKGKLKSSRAVFAGEVIEISKIPNTNKVLARIRLAKSWKRILPSQINVETEFADGASCGYKFEVGRNYLIFAYGSDDNRLSTSRCSLNREIEDAVEELKILGKGRLSKNKKSSFRQKVVRN